MSIILAKDSGEQHWHERAWYGGYGVLYPLPKTIEDIDRLMGAFFWFLDRKVPGTFLAVHHDASASPRVIAHARAMLSTLPRSTLLVSDDDDACIIEYAQRELSSGELNRIQGAVAKARKNGKKVILVHEPRKKQADNVIAEDMRALMALKPDFMVTEHVAIAKDCISQQSKIRLREIFRLKRAMKLRAFIGRWRVAIRQWPLRALLDLFEVTTGKVISFHTRPLYASGYTEPPNRFVKFPHCAIVLQGPLCLKRSFTLETARLYKKIFPYANVIVSTWIGEDESTLERLRESGAIVVTSDKPVERGWGNMNLQVGSTAAGIREAITLGAQYVLEQRSDRRIYNAVALEMMVSMLEYFPPGEKSHQKKRIIFDDGGPVYNPYWMGCMLFGAAEDLMEYFSLPLAPTDKTAYSCYLTEPFLVVEYLKRKGWKLDWTVEQGLEVYKECFIPLDWTMLDIYWYKYNRWGSTHQRSYTYSSPSKSLVGFGDWLSILVDRNNKIPLPEQRFVFEIEKRGGK